MKIAILTNYYHYSRNYGTELFNKTLIKLLLSNNHSIAEFATAEKSNENASEDLPAKFAKSYSTNQKLYHCGHFNAYKKIWNLKNNINSIIENFDLVIISGGQELTHIKIKNQKKLLYVQLFDQRMYSHKVLPITKRSFKFFVSLISPIKYKAKFIWNAENVVFFNEICVPSTSKVKNKFFASLPGLDFNVVSKTNPSTEIEHGAVYMARINAVQKNTFKLCKNLKNLDDYEIYGSGDAKNVQRVLKLVKDHYKGSFSHEKIISILRTSRCLLLSSRYEGMPMIVLDAASQGIPSIIFDTYDMARLFSQQGVSIIARDWKHFIEITNDFLKMSIFEIYLKRIEVLEGAKRISLINPFEQSWLQIINFFQNAN